VEVVDPPPRDLHVARTLLERALRPTTAANAEAVVEARHTTTQEKRFER
jgi:hypothetical protein